MKYYTHVAKYGNNILCRGKDENGKSIDETVKFKPSLFIQTDNPVHTQYKDFYGHPVVKKVFNNMYEMSQFAKEYRGMAGYVWGNTKCDVQYIYETFKNIEYNPRHIRSAFIDIEVMTRQKLDDGTFVNGGFPVASEAKYPINAICHYDSIDKVYYQFGLNCEWSKESSVFPSIAEKTVYYNCKSEEELLKKWINFFTKNYPDIITGWNVETFDIPYIVNRVQQVLGMTWVKQLSPWKIVNDREVKTQYGIDTTYELVGISTLDYLALYKKHTFKNRESYTLDYISKCELGADTHKMEFQGTHGEFYWNDPQGFYDYNLRDVELVKHLDDKLQLIDLVVSLAYYSGINYIDTFSPIKTWDSIIYRKCLDNNVIVPLGDNKKHREEYPGAWVFDTKVGFQKAIASFDFASLYPSLNRSFNIGADVLKPSEISNKIKKDIIKSSLDNNNSELAHLCSSNVPFNEYYLEHEKLPEYVTSILKEYKVSCTPNWMFYDTTKESIFTTLQTELYLGRKADKKLMQEYAHKAQKIEEEIQKRGLMNK